MERSDWKALAKNWDQTLLFSESKDESEINLNYKGKIDKARIIRRSLTSQSY